MIFICDVMLGKLARYLRMLGLDAPYIRKGEARGIPSGGRSTLLLLQRALRKAAALAPSWSTATTPGNRSSK